VRSSRQSGRGIAPKSRPSAPGRQVQAPPAHSPRVLPRRGDLILNATFVHLRGVGDRRERELWRKRVLTWDTLLKHLASGTLSITGCSPEALSRTLQDCRNAWANRDVSFFAERFPRREHYRLALAFPADVIFLDIETTGLSLYYDYITLVGWSIGDEYGLCLKGQSTDRLREALSRAKAIVTFNGSRFDLPFLRQEFPDLPIPSIHLDLCFLARRVGLGGPQKVIERKLRLGRSRDIAELDGRSAPLLWHEYRRGDIDALKRLIRYNHADIEGMKHILDVNVRRLILSQGVPRKLWPSHRFALSRSAIRWSGRPKEADESAIAVPRYRTDRPAVSLCSLGANSGLRIVGIDLTGSEKRASGWCLLVGKEAETRLIHSDEDLIQATIEARPDVISIDSPLSLPRGRNIVTDDDPARSAFGIVRTCERILRKRGINVYPCLLPSMQRLTERGIGLATLFRRIGLAVIESYPGAAQDILGIPRKRASLALLSGGLADFGVSGHWARRQVSHDELDSITAAVVGIFFWMGRFEGLGDEEEGQLVVPDLRTDPTAWQTRRVIGFSGPIGTGKTTAARLLGEHGYAYGRFSHVLGEILKSRGELVTRAALQDLGEKVYHNPGQRWLCQQLVAALPKTGNIVIDGLRHPEDHSFLVEQYGPAFIHVYVDAPADSRRARYEGRGASTGSFADASLHAIERNVSKLAPLAQHRVTNDKGLADFKAMVERIAGIESRG
jgi:uncharacterized protein YprB with RNaseH-like and TPR domain/predicted nuclease with RNAse H fold/dephospho-CoA kinase